MVTRFGSREICDVTFKSLVAQTIGTQAFAAGQPVFVIDTATTSNMEQATTTVYAQGGKGYNRLMSWEGEKTMTFTVTDALMSPLGLKILSGAGFADASSTSFKHVHVTMDLAVAKDSGQAEIKLSEIKSELGLPSTTTDVEICKDSGIKVYGTVLDNNGAIIDWISKVTITRESITGDDGTTTGCFTIDSTELTKIATYNTVKFDFYVVMKDNCTEITIGPDDFGGYFYVEADTLYRNQDGKDMAATLTFPKVKIQSGFTITMAANGDPSTFDFVMDAFPAYTLFDHTKKVVCDFTIVGGAKGDAGITGHVTTDAAATNTTGATG